MLKSSFCCIYKLYTLVYRCDPIRGRKAKIALIDCAHRETELNAKELRAKLIEAVYDKIRKGQKVVLPVPQYGRGLELLVLMRRTFPNLRVCVDSDFVTYAKKMLSERMWYFADAYECMNNEELYEMEIFGTQMPVYDYDILLLADTHLKKQKNVDFVNQQLQNNAVVFIIGRVKENGPVGKLLAEGRVERLLFPHHQSYGDLKRVVESNMIELTLPFHNCEKEIVF